MGRKIAWAALAPVLMAGCAHGPGESPPEVTAAFVAAPLPFEDPSSRLWEGLAEYAVPLRPQDIAQPMLTEAGAASVRVRALHDGQWVVLRLEWEDPTEDLIPRPGRSSDAAAVQFPLGENGGLPDAAMGEKGKGVRIWYWKALWQDDTARAQTGGKDRIAALYPGAAIDHYPYEANPRVRAEMERRYAPARAAGNPITAMPAQGPVQVLTAEGFGNTDPAPVNEGRGRGRWVAGKWTVTLARPLRGTQIGDLVPGRRTHVAFALWDGSRGHTGSRKMRSDWIPMTMSMP